MRRRSIRLACRYRAVRRIRGTIAVGGHLSRCGRAGSTCCGTGRSRSRARVPGRACTRVRRTCGSGRPAPVPVPPCAPGAGIGPSSTRPPIPGSRGAGTGPICIGRVWAIRLWPLWSLGGRSWPGLVEGPPSVVRAVASSMVLGPYALDDPVHVCVLASWRPLCERCFSAV